MMRKGRAHMALLILIVSAPLVHADSPAGSEMLGLETSLSNAPEGWRGWLRIPATAGSDVKRCVEGLSSPDRTLLLLVPPRKESYREDRWLPWAKEAVIAGQSAGIRYFQVGNAGQGPNPGWSSDPDAYFEDLLLPCQHIVKERGGKVVFCGVPWPGEGLNASRWMFEYGLEDTVSVLVSSSHETQELEYLHFQWIAPGKCDALWVDCTQGTFRGPQEWIFASHQFFLWSLKHQKLEDHPAVFFLPGTVLADENQRRLLHLQAELFDGPLSFCETPVFVHPHGQSNALMVGSSLLVAVMPDTRFPITISARPCQDVAFTDVMGLSMTDGKEISLRKNRQGDLLRATVPDPREEGFLLRFSTY